MSHPPEVTRELYLQWRAPRFGERNPDPMTNPVWSWLAREPELSAYSANGLFDGPKSFGYGPAWCCARFGQSRTELADGRVLRIAGEHEDHYDPDFYIYNDVIVDAPDGSVAIYGYPRELFGPTDFHSATVVGDELLVIGNLGYAQDRRVGVTPIVRLDLRTLAVSPVSAQGTPPGWIHEHTATLSDDRRSILVSGGQVETEGNSADNCDDWSLDLGTLTWTRLTERRWQQWELQRADGKSNNLFGLSMAVQYGDVGLIDDPKLAKFFADRAAVLTNRPLYESRYSPPVPHEKLPDGEDVPLVVRRVIENVVVRYVEQTWSVRVVVEGSLAPALVDTIVDDACAKLAALEGIAWTKMKVV